MSNPEVKIRLSLDGAGQVQAGVQGAAASLDKLNQSGAKAGQQAQLTGQQVAQVSAQLQDLFVQIQAGGAPMTALIQQGSQLSAVFGGFGNAARAVASLVTPAVAVLGTVATASAAVGFAAYKGAQELTEFQRQLILTGNAAGVTTGELMQMAGALDATGRGITQGKAAEVLAQLAATGQVGAGNMQRFTAATIEFERAGGQAAETTIKAFAEIGKAPLEASIKLNEAQNYLTRSTLEQIRALEDQGRSIEAAKVAQEAYASAVEQRTAALEKNLGTLERAWRGVKETAAEAWDKMLGVGRPLTMEDQLKGVQAEIARRVENNQNLGIKEGRATQELREQANLLSRRLLIEKDVAAAEAAAVQGVKDNIEANKVLEQLGVKRLSQSQQEEALRRQLVAGGIAQVEIEKAITALREKNRDKGPAGAGGDPFAADREAAQEWARAYQDFSRAALDAEAKTLSLTKSQQRLVEFLTSPGYKNMPDAPRELALSQAYAAITAEQLVEAEKKAAEAARDTAKAMAEVERAYEQQVDALQRSAAAVAEQVDRMQLEEAAAYLAADANITLAQAIQRLTLARLREKQAEQYRSGNQEAGDAIKAEIEQREKLLALIEGKDASAAFQQQMKERQQAAESILNAVEGTAHRVWTDVANGGQDAFKRIGNTIKASVLDLLYQITIKKWVLSVTANVLGTVGGAGAGPAGAAGNALGAVSNGLNLYNAGATAAGLWGSSAAYGAAIGTTSIGAGSQAAMLAAQTGAFGAEGAAMTAAAAGNAATGSIMSTIGAAAPYVAAVFAIYALAKSLDKSGTPHVGGSSSYSASGGLATGEGLYGVGSKLYTYSSQTEQLTTQITQSVVGILDSTAASFGKQAGYSAAAAFADDSSSDGAWGALAIKIGDKMVAGFGVEGNGKWPGRGFADGQAGADQYLAAISNDVRTALNGIGLPDWAKSMLDKLGDAPGLDKLAQTVAQINAIETAISNLGKAMPEFANLTDAAVTSLISSFGGVDNLTAAASSFYENFVPEAERKASSIKQITDELAKVGLSLPATREQYRELVQQQDKNTESGLAAYTALIKLNGVFAALVPATEAAGTAVATLADQMAEAVQRTVKQLQQRGDELMVELLNAQGDTAGAASLRRQVDLAGLLDGISGAGAEAITALYDKNKGIQDQLEALKKASSDQAAADQRASAVASERLGLEGRLLQLQGDTATLRARELAALDASNRGYQEQIYALQDQQAAAEKAAQALQAVNGALSSLDGSYASQRVEMLTLQGKTAEAEALKRQTDLANLTAGMSEADAAKVTAAYDRNAALQKEIDATRAAQQAAEAIARAQEQAAETAARAAQQLKDAWQSATDTLFTEAAKIRGLTTSDSPASLAAAQAQFAITSAQARAGDQDAVKQLPELARLVVEIGKSQAGSQLELDRLRAAVAASLEGTGNKLAGTYGLAVPKLATGTNYVPRDMLAFLHEGEAVQPRAFNPAAGGGADVAELVREVKALREQVYALQSTSGRTATASERTRDLLTTVTENGRAMQTEAAS